MQTKIPSGEFKLRIQKEWGYLKKLAPCVNQEGLKDSFKYF